MPCCTGRLGEWTERDHAAHRDRGRHRRGHGHRPRLLADSTTRLRCGGPHRRHGAGMEPGRGRAALLSQPVRPRLTNCRTRVTCRFRMGRPERRRGISRSAERARRDGFQAKLCMHPQQVAAVRLAYTPSAEAVAHAQRVLDAFAEGMAALRVDGRLVDYPNRRSRPTDPRRGGERSGALIEDAVDRVGGGPGRERCDSSQSVARVTICQGLSRIRHEEIRGAQLPGKWTLRPVARWCTTARRTREAGRWWPSSRRTACTRGRDRPARHSVEAPAQARGQTAGLGR